VSARILVVEDNRTNLELMLYLLHAFGHRPKGAGNGVAGWKAVRSERYDLVLCDVLMPGIDGFEFARRFKTDSSLRGVALVAVTALAMVGDRERVLKAGFDGYIAKPIDPETFVTQVDAFLPPALRSTAGAGARVERSDAQATEAPTDGPVVLAVDDVQVNLDVIGGALRPLGFRVIEARGGTEGFERARQTPPDIILCDVNMEHGDGFEFIQRVKSDPDLSAVPFLFITSTAWGSGNRLRGLELGAEEFIQRPIDPASLIEEVERALRGRRGKDTGR
jgi:two-component system cell cycle response regulator